MAYRRRMRNDQIALQLYTLRRLAAVDLPGTLEAVAAAGFRAVELAGLPETGPGELARLLHGAGLRVVAAHESIVRDFGACMSPANAFYLLQGVETLPVRMERHCRNALAVAQFLRNHPRVSWVNYPGLPDHAQHELLARQMRRVDGAPGGSGLLAFGVKSAAGDAEGVGARIGRYAAALSRGDDAATAYRDLTAALST